MKKIVIVCGLISGSINAILMAIGMITCYNDPNYEHSMVKGFAAMILAFSLIFVGVKMLRDKYNGGIISFGKAFLTGVWIAFIASTMYVATWAILYNFYMPDFMDRYGAQMIEAAKKAGGTADKIKAATEEVAKYKKMYKSPLFFTLMTYVEIFPLGLLISLICALILKRKNNPTQNVAAA